MNLNLVLETSLKPFLENFHQGENVLFWPDLATSHYAKITQEKLKAMKIKFIARDANPPNLPMCRPIEHFWSNLKTKVYENGWEANDFESLKERILEKVATFDENDFYDLMKNVKLNVRYASKYGPLSLV